MGLSLGFLSFSIGLYFCFCASTMLSRWLYHCSIVWSQEGWFLQLFFFLKIVLAIQGLLCFHTNCDFFFLCVLVTQSRPTLCKPTDCSLTGSSVYGILQGRILEWLAIPFSRGSSQPRNWTLVSCIGGRFYTIWASGKNTRGSFIVIILKL